VSRDDPSYCLGNLSSFSWQAAPFGIPHVFSCDSLTAPPHRQLVFDLSPPGASMSVGTVAPDNPNSSVAVTTARRCPRPPDRHRLQLSLSFSSAVAHPRNLSYSSEFEGRGGGERGRGRSCDRSRERLSDPDSFARLVPSIPSSPPHVDHLPHPHTTFGGRDTLIISPRRL
jgi:hypothetical protein